MHQLDESFQRQLELPVLATVLLLQPVEQRTHRSLIGRVAARLQIEHIAQQVLQLRPADVARGAARRSGFEASGAETASIRVATL